MAETLQFELVSPERKLASVEATAVQIPGMAGDFTAMPNHAPWPKETSPVMPTRMLSAMQAMAKTTISVAEVVPRPIRCISEGRASSPAAARRRGR